MDKNAWLGPVALRMVFLLYWLSCQSYLWKVPNPKPGARISLPDDWVSFSPFSLLSSLPAACPSSVKLSKQVSKVLQLTKQLTAANPGATEAKSLGQSMGQLQIPPPTSAGSQRRTDDLKSASLFVWKAWPNTLITLLHVFYMCLFFFLIFFSFAPVGWTRTLVQQDTGLRGRLEKGFVATAWKHSKVILQNDCKSQDLTFTPS